MRFPAQSHSLGSIRMMAQRSRIRKSNCSRLYSALALRQSQQCLCMSLAVGRSGIGTRLSPNGNPLRTLGSHCTSTGKKSGPKRGSKHSLVRGTGTPQRTCRRRSLQGKRVATSCRCKLTLHQQYLLVGIQLGQICPSTASCRRKDQQHQGSKVMPNQLA